MTMEITAVENGWVVAADRDSWCRRKSHVFTTWSGVTKFVADNQVRNESDDA
jgi:ABC-type Fe3+-citrate transport system substrate-binding protein